MKQKSSHPFSSSRITRAKESSELQADMGMTTVYRQKDPLAPSGASKSSHNTPEGIILADDLFNS